MKRAILLYRLPHLLLGVLITDLILASSVVLPATPAQAADRYLNDESVSEDLSFKSSSYAGEKKELSEIFETEDSTKLCEKLKSKRQEYLKKYDEDYKNDFGIINPKIDNCRFEGSLFFIDMSGKYDEKLLKKTTSESDRKIKNEGELEFKDYIIYSGQSSDLDKIVKQENIGVARYKFPGKIKSVTPNIGKISGNTWILGKSVTSEEWDQLERSGGKVTFTAERYGSKFQLDEDGGQINSTTERHDSKLGLILGITIPAALILVAAVLGLAVRSKRKKKQQNLPPYPTGSSTYPPPPFMPGNSPNPVQSQAPDFPEAPGAPDIPGTAPYPPNVPPKGQPGAPIPGSYNPYPYPYPPANPQNPAAWNSPMPNQGYGAPAPGFPPPQAPSGSAQPRGAAAPGQPEQPGEPKHVLSSPQPGQSKELGKLE